MIKSSYISHQNQKRNIGGFCISEKHRGTTGRWRSMMKGFIRLAAAGALILSLSVPVYADKSAKTELPAETTDYYMTVDSGGVGVDIYPETDSKSEKLNGTTIEDGTVLHIEGETEKNGENWGYTEYKGGYGYVPLDELRPSKDEELAQAGITGKETAEEQQQTPSATETPSAT